MGKAAQCVKMLEILNSGRIYKASELAYMLDTNVRNIIEYRKELEEVGYYINSIPGRYGGYQLDRSLVIPSLHFTEKEKEALTDCYEYISSKNDFMNKEDLALAIGKINSTTYDNPSFVPIMSGNFYRLKMSLEEIKERYNFFENCIESKTKCKFSYDNLKYGLMEVIVHPYALINYKDAWFLIGLNPKAGNIWQFKLNRIYNFEKLDEKFIPIKDFNLRDYFNESGFVNKSEKFHLTVLVRKVIYSLFKERIYGDNQKIEDYDDEWHLVNVDVKNFNFIRDFVLRCGCDIKIIEPQWLKEEVIDIYKKCIDLY